MADAEHVSIARFARAGRVTVRALRHYHALGLLVPDTVDPITGYRSYQWSQLTDLLAITTMRGIGVPLEAVRDHLVAGAPLAQVLARERSRLEQEAARVARALAVIEMLADATALPVYDTVVVELEASPALTATGMAVGARLRADVERLVERLVRSAGDADADAPIIAEYPLELDGTFLVRAHLPVVALPPPDALEADGVAPSATPAGRYAMVTHVGPLESLTLAYHGLFESLHSSGYPVRGPVLERYVDDPSVVDPESLRTEVLHRVPDPH